jgi:hypothetical protein
MTRRHSSDTSVIRQVINDQLAARDALAERVNALVQLPADESGMELWSGTTLVAIESSPNARLTVRYAGLREGVCEFDAILAMVGYRPDDSLHSELQVDQCCVTQAPRHIASHLLSQADRDCMDYPSAGPAALVHPEPDFYVLGSKSYGRNSNFLLAAGLEQIRDVFTMIADRADLDLYRTMEHLVS